MNATAAPRTTLHHRLRAMIVTTTALALLTSSGAYLTYDYFSFRKEFQAHLQVMTDVMATQNSPALAFRDPHVASENLRTLSAVPHILGAALYDRDGILLSRYLRPGAVPTLLPSTPPPEGALFESGALGIARPVTTDGERLGTIYLRSDLDEASDRLEMSLAIVGLVLIVVLFLSAVLSARMIGSINRPIAALVELVKAVSASRDYSLRAERKGPEELIVLIEGINDMFSQIQARDGALQQARNNLEVRVVERTAELTRVNRNLSEEIAERTRMEGSLRESEERYRQLVELSPDAIMVHREEQILFVNSAALRLFGARDTEHLLKTPLMDLIAPEFRDTVRLRIWRIGTELQAVPPMEQKLLRLDGTPLEVEAQGTPFVFQGQPAVQAVLRDISKRKQIEQMKDEFVSTVSHELRTPLTSIQGSLGLIANGVTGPLSAGTKPLVDIAYKNCSRLILLINDILDSEKIAAGKMAFTFRELELLPLLASAIDGNRAYGAQYGITYELSSSAEGARVEVDPDRLTQALTNLMSNAAKFSPRGGVVTVDVSRHEASIRIAVIDRGAGIPAEFRDRIFQKFSQADSSDTRTKGGTGLGLSISKAIVEKHGGSLSFESEVGRGTTFLIDLPERFTAPAATSQPSALVCDDDPHVAEIIRVVLEREGFRVAVAATLGEARVKLSHGPVDLITLDDRLPDGNGLDFLRNLRNLPTATRVQVLLFSPLAKELSEEAADDLDPVHFLEKPVDLRTLVDAARTALEMSTTLMRVLPH